MTQERKPPTDAQLAQAVTEELADVPVAERAAFLAEVEQIHRRKLDFDMLRAIRAYRAAQAAQKASPNS